MLYCPALPSSFITKNGTSLVRHRVFHSCTLKEGIKSSKCDRCPQLFLSKEDCDVINFKQDTLRVAGTPTLTYQGIINTGTVLLTGTPGRMSLVPQSELILPGCRARGSIIPLTDAMLSPQENSFRRL